MFTGWRALSFEQYEDSSAEYSIQRSEFFRNITRVRLFHSFLGYSMTNNESDESKELLDVSPV